MNKSEDNDESEEIDIKEIITPFKKINPKIIITICIICLLFLCYQLGFMLGYNESFYGQKEYYEYKMEYYCICQDGNALKFTPTIKSLNLSFG